MMTGGRPMTKRKPPYTISMAMLAHRRLMVGAKVVAHGIAKPTWLNCNAANTASAAWSTPKCGKMVNWYNFSLDNSPTNYTSIHQESNASPSYQRTYLCFEGTFLHELVTEFYPRQTSINRRIHQVNVKNQLSDICTQRHQPSSLIFFVGLP